MNEDVLTLKAPRCDTSPPLSKSGFVAGLQCAKWLWFRLNSPERIPVPDTATLSLFDQGQTVGLLARTLFPGGAEVRNWKDSDQLRDSTDALYRRIPIFEGAFHSNGLLAKVDILNPVGRNDWDLYEVKSTSEAKPEHIWDVAFQAHVLSTAGVKLRHSYILHLNRDYVRKGAIETASLFVATDITAQVQQAAVEIPDKIHHLLAQVRKETAPEIPIGRQCRRPVSCPLKDACWSFLGEDNVLELYRGGTKAWTLLRQGVTKLKDMPNTVSLTARQTIQVEASRSNKVNLRRQALRRFLGQLHFPLHFIDFETVNPAIPIWDNSKPFDQTPFQYSLHIIEDWDASPIHHSFLSAGQNDPRPEIMRCLTGLIRPQGSILAYNSPFEMEVLNRCAGIFPEFQGWWKSARTRFLDLLKPFRDFDYYAPAQHGSASMKSVMPAMCGVGYQDLAIQDGAAASQAFLKATFGNIASEEKDRIRKNLETYCHRDTAGMLMILRELKRLVEL